MNLDDILNAFAHAHVPPSSEPRVSCAARQPSPWGQVTAVPHANGTTTEGAR